MAGIKIKHTSLTSCVLRIEDTLRPYTIPYDCPTCMSTHENKTYHLHLDSSGEVIVSTGVYAQLLSIAGDVGNLDSLSLDILDLLVLAPPARTLSPGGNWVQHDLA